jgi:hypothetical protein
MIRAMSEPDDRPVGFFFGPDAEGEPAPTGGWDEAASHTTPAAAESEAWTAPATSTESAEPGTSTVPATPVMPAQPPAPTVGPEPTAAPGTTTGTTADGAEKYSVVNADGSTTSQLPDGSFQTVVRLPGGATIVTSTRPAGSSPSAAPVDPPRERRWRRRDR